MIQKKIIRETRKKAGSSYHLAHAYDCKCKYMREMLFCILYCIVIILSLINGVWKKSLVSAEG